MVPNLNGDTFLSRVLKDRTLKGLRTLLPQYNQDLQQALQDYLVEDATNLIQEYASDTLDEIEAKLSLITSTQGQNSSAQSSSSSSSSSSSNSSSAQTSSTSLGQTNRLT